MTKLLRAKLHISSPSFGWRSSLSLTADEVRGRQADIVELMCSDARMEDMNEVEVFYRCIPANSKMRLLCDQQGPLFVVKGHPFTISRLEDIKNVDSCHTTQATD